MVQKRWERETAGFCTTRPQLHYSSENEVVEVEIAVSQSNATQLGEYPETEFVGLVREARREVCVSTLTAKEKREQARANQSEISSFMKHAALQSATWSGVHPHTKTGVDSETSLARLGIRRSAAGSERHCITDSVTLWSTNLLDCGKITENAIASHVPIPSGPPRPPWTNWTNRTNRTGSPEEGGAANFALSALSGGRSRGGVAADLGRGPPKLHVWASLASFSKNGTQGLAPRIGRGRAKVDLSL